MSDLHPLTERLFSILRVVCTEDPTNARVFDETSDDMVPGRHNAAWRRLLHEHSIRPFLAMRGGEYRSPFTLRFDWAASMYTLHSLRHPTIEEAWEALIVAGLVHERHAWRFNRLKELNETPYPQTFDALLCFAWYTPQALLEAEELGRVFYEPDTLPRAEKVLWTYGPHKNITTAIETAQRVRIRDQLAKLGFSLRGKLMINESTSKDEPDFRVYPVLAYHLPYTP